MSWLFDMFMPQPNDANHQYAMEQLRLMRARSLAMRAEWDVSNKER